MDERRGLGPLLLIMLLFGITYLMHFMLISKYMWFIPTLQRLSIGLINMFYCMYTCSIRSRWNLFILIHFIHYEYKAMGHNSWRSIYSHKCILCWPTKGGGVIYPLCYSLYLLIIIQTVFYAIHVCWHSLTSWRCHERFLRVNLTNNRD